MMRTGDQRTELLAIVRRARRRWRAMAALRAWTLASAVMTLTLGMALVAQRAMAPQGVWLIAWWSITVVTALFSAAWLLAPLRRVPGDGTVARYIEERFPDLEDTLVTSIAHARADDTRPIVAAVLDDAVRRARRLDVARIVSGRALRHAAIRAAAATVALSVMVGFSIGPVERAAGALMMYAFPTRLVLDVAPGDVKVRAGETLRIVARIANAAGGVVPTLRIHESGGWRETGMEDGSEGFAAALEDIQEGFRYAVAAAGIRSREYTVTVMRPPRVERIDLRYEYPPAFRMDPRVEEDGGDVYGPAGTRVRFTVRTNEPVMQGTLRLSGGQRLALVGLGTALEGELTIREDDSYRVALADAEGVDNPGDTEYFIRTVQDAPPDVRIVLPGSDRAVNPIEEVSIEAQADDDFGIAQFDLVYAVRGGNEQTLPFDRDGSGPTVNGRRTIYLEDLGVQPGDFVAYHARARDVSRGKASSEARSDIYFLEVKPFGTEFVAAQSQAGGSRGGEEEDRSLEGLVDAQKDVIASTWKLDRRSRDSGGRSGDDIRAVARAQGEIRRRVTGASVQSQRAEDLRRRLRGRRAPGGAPEASDDALIKAIEEMGAAQQQLEALKTSRALPHEMAALNELLRAQAEIRRREVQRQEATNNSSGGAGSNRQTQDLSSLFDRELTRQQQTNYEMPNSAETHEPKAPGGNDALEKIRDLARRQETLNREQDTLAKRRQDVSEEDARRQLEKLKREQNELRQQAEALARQLRQGEPNGTQPGQGQSRQREQKAGGPGQGGQRASGAAPGQPQEAGRALQQAAEDMRNAASGTGRPDQGQASASGSRALERLREGEQQMRAGRPDERRRELGDMRMETRQLADAQRRLSGGALSNAAKEAPRQADANASADAQRRRSAEQERLADRMERLERSIRQLSGGQAATPSDRAALTEAARELARQKLSERMRAAARGGREGDQPVNGPRGTSSPSGRGELDPAPPPRVPSHGAAETREGEKIAAALDRLGDQLGSAAGETDQASRLSEQLSRARDTREQLAAVDRQLSELRRRAEQGGPAQRDDDGPSPGSGRDGQPRSPGRGEARGRATSGEWEQARGLLEELKRDQDMGLSTRDVEGFNPGISAPGTEGWKQDFTRWEQLKVQIAAALEKLESAAAARLHQQPSTDRLNAGPTQAVPVQYRDLVDKYYRALASKR
jgi:hypothetical protein